MGKCTKDIQKKIYRILKWQSCGFVHPLTCGKNSEHILKPKEKDGDVILICPDCDYVQNHVPDVVYETDI